jgi:hypothetical protein
VKHAKTRQADRRARTDERREAPHELLLTRPPLTP